MAFYLGSRTMSLNIKSAEAHELAGQLPHLEWEKRKKDKEQLVADLLAIAERASTCEWRDDVTPAEFLYDERGLPR